MAQQSLSLDRRVLGIDVLPRALRWRVLTQKYIALAILLTGRAAVVDLGHVKFRARDISDLGVLQSCLVDIYEELVISGALEASGSQTIVDIGANVGQFSAAVKLLCPKSSVIAFEPDPDVFELLQNNLACLPSVQVRCLALGSTSVQLPLYRHKMSIFSSLRPTIPVYDMDNTVDVEVWRLDDVFSSDNMNIDLLKIDVEGFELEVLVGAVKTLANTRYLLVEIGLERECDGINLDVLSLVKQVAPDARIMRFGRPLGTARHPICQDVLIELHATSPGRLMPR